ncbi:MAG: sulfotransferase family 2 domain-containing protein [Candidatus Omnitrophica bacterium]|nr:sulfotransferase family 2 domain-containing protein [Candidatus Omnitrophota bacterium]
MPLFTKNGKTILFIHIPKTGGTSVMYFLIENAFSVNWFVSSYDIINREPSPQHRHREKIIEFLNKESVEFDYNFTIVRNPIDKLISEYFQQCRNKEKLHKKITRKDFCYWVDKVFKLHKENPIYFDNHIRPQTEFLLEDTIIFKYENNYKDLFDFLKDIGRKHHFNIDFKKFPHKTKGYNKKPIEIPKQTLRKIFQFYKTDFDKFYPL